MKIDSLPILAGGALLAAFSLAAVAQQKPEARTLTRDEFRACLDSQDQLKARADTIKPKIAKLKEEQAAIKTEDDELVAEKERIADSSFPGTRDRFERKVRAHEMRAKSSEDQGKALNAEVAQINKEQDDYNARCGIVTVRPADRDAVMKEREAAGKK
jgi:uncharacterized coiled-coil DUF342 family protein